MKYYLIAGEASGDLHASRLMFALKEQDPEAEFRFIGGDLMATAGGTMVKHYSELAYMGFIPVLLHLPTILSNMKRCKQDITAWQPDVVILVDYPGFNLSIAKYVHKKKGAARPKDACYRRDARRSKKRSDDIISVVSFSFLRIARKHRIEPDRSDRHRPHMPARNKGRHEAKEYAAP